MLQPSSGALCSSVCFVVGAFRFLFLSGGGLAVSASVSGSKHPYHNLLWLRGVSCCLPRCWQAPRGAVLPPSLSLGPARGVVQAVPPLLALPLDDRDQNVNLDFAEDGERRQGRLQAGRGTGVLDRIFQPFLPPVVRLLRPAPPRHPAPPGGKEGRWREERRKGR